MLASLDAVEALPWTVSETWLKAFLAVRAVSIRIYATGVTMHVLESISHVDEDVIWMKRLGRVGKICFV